MRLGFRRCHVRVTDDDHGIADLHQPRRGAVHADRPRIGRFFDGVSFEARAVCHIHHLHALERQDVGGSHEVGINADAPLVIELSLGHGRLVQLRLA